MRQEMHNLKIKHSSRSQGLDGKNQRDTSVGQLDMFQELQERTDSARNIMVFNVEKSKSKKVKDRVSHDKSQILELLTKLDVEPVDFRVYRIGRTSSLP
ncbi:hypothetical protein WA026_021777 [Henosepilachna vigintioctopunctata]|uniref:Uncharacterized protein n=1 Tax=Henosepilachna vigintioctopunctata TaxID=420089 RepID=A0AAW1TXY8_9CUCU